MRTHPNKWNLLLRITAASVAVILFWACKDTSAEAAKLFYRPHEPLPTGQTIDFKAYYTLKGKVAMQLQAPRMDDYADREFPRQIFPQGVYVEIYNDRRQKTVIRADCAVVYKKNGLTELTGNVIITAPDSSLLKTSRLFWDRMNEHIFTDEPIEFRRKDEYIRGEGFDSNMSFTTARVNNVKGIFRVTLNK